MGFLAGCPQVGTLIPWSMHRFLLKTLKCFLDPCWQIFVKSYWKMVQSAEKILATELRQFDTFDGSTALKIRTIFLYQYGLAGFGGSDYDTAGRKPHLSALHLSLWWMTVQKSRRTAWGGDTLSEYNSEVFRIISYWTDYSNKNLVYLSQEKDELLFGIGCFHMRCRFYWIYQLVLKWWQKAPPSYGGNGCKIIDDYPDRNAVCVIWVIFHHICSCKQQNQFSRVLFKKGRDLEALYCGVNNSMSAEWVDAIPVFRLLLFRKKSLCQWSVSEQVK